ncbi:TPA: hypothetical protein ACGO0F_001314 [Streptococcus suis]
MTEKLGVLLVDVPEPRFWRYYPIQLIEYNKEMAFDVSYCDTMEGLMCKSYIFTQEEAEKYPQLQLKAHAVSIETLCGRTSCGTYIAVTITNQYMK